MRRLIPDVAAGCAAAAIALLGNRAAVRRIRPGSGSRWLRTNHAGVPVTLAEGPVAVAAVLAGVVAGRLAVRRTAHPGSGAAAVAAVIASAGAGLVGAYDDLYGTAQAKGFGGHLRALRAGSLTSGSVKIAGVGSSALAAAFLLRRGRRQSGGPGGAADLLIDTALIAGTANLCNLFDLRPGRTAKVVLLLGAPLLGVGTGPALGGAVGSLPTDLAARSMLGDCGANALGAAVATAAADALPRWARVTALVAVVGLNLASERVSFTAVIERVPWLRSTGPVGATGPAGPRPAAPGG